MIIDTTSSFSPETSHASFPKKEKKKEREIDRDMEYYEDEIMDLCAQIPGISRNIFKTVEIVKKKGYVYSNVILYYIILY